MCLLGVYACYVCVLGVYAWCVCVRVCTFEKSSKQPSRLMMQYTSGSLRPFPLGCEHTHTPHTHTHHTHTQQGASDSSRVTAHSSRLRGQGRVFPLSHTASCGGGGRTLTSTSCRCHAAEGHSGYTERLYTKRYGVLNHFLTLYSVEKSTAEMLAYQQTATVAEPPASILPGQDEGERLAGRKQTTLTV